MNLREAILKKLTGTSGQNPVLLDDLRKMAEPICDDLQQLYEQCEKLYQEKIVNRVAGFKQGKQYVAYWLTGNTTGVCTPFRITTPAPPYHRLEGRRIATPEQAPAKMQPAAANVQEKTAEVQIPSAVNQKAESQPISQESTMPQAQPQKQSWLKNVTDLVAIRPGIKRDDVIKELLLLDDSNRKSLLACISNAIYNEVLRVEKKNGVDTLHPGKKANWLPKISAAKKSKKADSKISKPAVAPPQPLPVPATFDPGFSFAFGVRKDGGISIFKEGKTLSLSSSEVKTIIDHATI